MSVVDDTVPYRRWERFADRWRGRKDGRRRLPSYSDLVDMAAADGMITAPRPEKLIWQTLRRIEAEYLAFEQRTAGHRASLARMRKDLEAAGVGLDRTTAAIAIAESPLTEAELRPRNYAELAPENRVVLLSRRDAARNRRIAEARGDEVAQFNALNGISSQIEAVKEQIKKEFVVAQTRARQAGVFCAVRVAAYWENVVLVHPEGPHLAPLLRFAAQVLPSWVTASPDSDPAELGRGPFELHRLAQRLNPQPRPGRDRKPARAAERPVATDDDTREVEDTA